MPRRANSIDDAAIQQWIADNLARAPELSSNQRAKLKRLLTDVPQESVKQSKSGTQVA